MLLSIPVNYPSSFNQRYFFFFDEKQMTVELRIEPITIHSTKQTSDPRAASLSFEWLWMCMKQSFSTTPRMVWYCSAYNLLTRSNLKIRYITNFPTANALLGAKIENQLNAKEPKHIPFFIFVSNTHEFNLSFEITRPECILFTLLFSPIPIRFFFCFCFLSAGSTADLLRVRLYF